MTGSKRLQFECASIGTDMEKLPEELRGTVKMLDIAISKAYRVNQALPGMDIGHEISELERIMSNIKSYSSTLRDINSSLGKKLAIAWK